MTFCWLLQRCVSVGLFSWWYTRERKDKRQHHSAGSGSGQADLSPSGGTGALALIPSEFGPLPSLNMIISPTLYMPSRGHAQALCSLLNLNVGKFVTISYIVLRQLIIFPHITKASADKMQTTQCSSLVTIPAEVRSAHLSEDLLEHNSRRPGG